VEVLGGNTIVQLTFSPTVCPKLQLPDTLKMVKNSGFSRIQLERLNSASSPVQNDTSVSMVRERLSSAGIKLSGLTIRSLTGRKADSNERNLAYNLRQIEWDIHLARALGTKNIALSGGDSGQESFDDLVEGIQSLIERVPDVNIILMNRSDSCFNSLQDVQSVLSKIGDSRFQIRVDTNELLVCGEDVIEYTSAIGDRVGDVSIRCGNEIEFGDAGYKEKLISDLISLLQSLKFKGPLIVEGDPLPVQEGIDLLRGVRENIQNLIN